MSTKKIASIVGALALSAVAVSSFAGCNREVVTPNAGEEGTTAVVSEVEAGITEASADKVETGTIELVSGIKITLTDGWYSNDTSDDTDVKLEKEGLPFLSNIHVTILQNYLGENDAAKWCENTNHNYGGGCESEEVEINGIHYYLLHAAENQNILFADVDENTVLEVAVMYFDYSLAEAQLQNIAF